MFIQSPSLFSSTKTLKETRRRLQKVAKTLSIQNKLAADGLVLEHAARPARLGARSLLLLDTAVRRTSLETRLDGVESTVVQDGEAAHSSGLMSTTALGEVSVASTMVAQANRVQRCIVLEVKSHAIESNIVNGSGATASTSDGHSIIGRESTSLGNAEIETTSFDTRLNSDELCTTCVSASRVYDEGPAQAEFLVRDTSATVGTRRRTVSTLLSVAPTQESSLVRF